MLGALEEILLFLFLFEEGEEAGEEWAPEAEEWAPEAEPAEEWAPEAEPTEEWAPEAEPAEPPKAAEPPEAPTEPAKTAEARRIIVHHAAVRATREMVRELLAAAGAYAYFGEAAALVYTEFLDEFAYAGGAASGSATPFMAARIHGITSVMFILWSYPIYHMHIVVKMLCLPIGENRQVMKTLLKCSSRVS